MPDAAGAAGHARHAAAADAGRIGIRRGFGTGADAVFDAVQEAVERLDADARGVLLFAPAELDSSAAAAQAACAAPGALVAGMTSAGVIGGASALDDAACAALAFDESFQFAVGVAG